MRYFTILVLGISYSLTLLAQIAPDSLVEGNGAQRHLEIDAQRAGFKAMIKQLSVLSDLEHVSITNLKAGQRIPAIDFPARLKTLTVANSDPRQVGHVLSKVRNKEHITSLQLLNNGLNELPRPLRQFHRLRTLVCSGNTGLDLIENAATLNSLSTMRVLHWNNNGLQELPEYLPFFERLDELSLRGNDLVELPVLLPATLRNLRKLDLSENGLMGAAWQFHKLNLSRIREVKMDGSELIYDEREALKLNYPRTHFEFFGESSETGVQTDTTTMRPQAAIGADSISQQLKYSTSVKGGYLKDSSGVSPYKAYSTAYVHYPAFFSNPTFEYNFDSTLFEERYRDTTYAGVYRILPYRSYENLKLTLARKPAKEEVWFEFLRKKRFWFLSVSYGHLIRYLNKNHPELNAFRNMVFVLQDESTKREFRKTYIKKRYYTDFRLYYQEASSNFILELKGLNGFEQLVVYPKYKNRERSLESAQETYTRRYVSYARALDRRKARFNRKLERTKQRYTNQYYRTLDQAWEEFSNMYMSEEEKNMSREEWLTYYDEVVANEKQALDNAPMSSDNFCHSLRLDGYAETDFGGLAFMLEKTVAVPVEFEDANGNRLPVKSYIIVHQSGRRFVRMEGGMGQRANLLFTGLADDTKVILELRNGDMAVVQQPNLKMLTPAIDNVQVVKANVFDANNGHVAMIHEQIR